MLETAADSSDDTGVPSSLTCRAHGHQHCRLGRMLWLPDCAQQEKAVPHASDQRPVSELSKMHGDGLLQLSCTKPGSLRTNQLVRRRLLEGLASCKFKSYRLHNADRVR